MGGCETFLLILITIIFPPAGVAIVAGCGVDLLINILLTCLGYIPGHIHAFYIEYRIWLSECESILTTGPHPFPQRKDYLQRKQEMANATSALPPVPGVYSDRVRYGGRGGAYQKEYQSGYVDQIPGQGAIYSSGAGLAGQQQQGTVYY